MQQRMIHGITAITRRMDKCLQIAPPIALTDKFSKQRWPQRIVTTLLTGASHQPVFVLHCHVPISRSAAAISDDTSAAAPARCARTMAPCASARA